MFVKILITAKEPLSVGMESIGIKTLLYKIPVILKDGEILQLPIIPGNSFRGVLRDTMAKRFILDVCENHPDSGRVEIDAGTALSMFSGGVLSRRGASEVESVHTLIEGYAQYLLPLSILGFAVSNTIVPGKIKIGCGYPIVKETKDLVEDIYWVDTSVKLEDICTDILLTRKNDIDKITQIREIHYDEVKAKEYLGSESEEAGALQQRMIREAIIPGTIFVTYVRDVLPLRPEEKGLLWKALGEIRSLGGSTARGLGEVKLSIYNEGDTEKAEKEYKTFIQNNIKKIDEVLKKSPTDF